MKLFSISIITWLLLLKNSVDGAKYPENTEDISRINELLDTPRVSIDPKIRKALFNVLARLEEREKVESEQSDSETLKNAEFKLEDFEKTWANEIGNSPSKELETPLDSISEDLNDEQFFPQSENQNISENTSSENLSSENKNSNEILPENFENLLRENIEKQSKDDSREITKSEKSTNEIFRLVVADTTKKAHQKSSTTTAKFLPTQSTIEDSTQQVVFYKITQTAKNEENLSTEATNNFINSKSENDERKLITVDKVNGTDPNATKVEFFGAPLVAAFTLQQDARGVPMKITPLADIPLQNNPQKSTNETIIEPNNINDKKQRSNSFIEKDNFDLSFLQRERERIIQELIEAKNQLETERRKYLEELEAKKNQNYKAQINIPNQQFQQQIIPFASTQQIVPFAQTQQHIAPFAQTQQQIAPFAQTQNSFNNLANPQLRNVNSPERIQLNSNYPIPAPVAYIAKPDARGQNPDIVFDFPPGFNPNDPNAFVGSNRQILQNVNNRITPLTGVRGFENKQFNNNNENQQQTNNNAQLRNNAFEFQPNNNVNNQQFNNNNGFTPLRNNAFQDSPQFKNNAPLQNSHQQHTQAVFGNSNNQNSIYNKNLQPQFLSGQHRFSGINSIHNTQQFKNKPQTEDFFKANQYARNVEFLPSQNLEFGPSRNLDFVPSHQISFNLPSQQNENLFQQSNGRPTRREPQQFIGNFGFQEPYRPPPTLNKQIENLFFPTSGSKSEDVDIVSKVLALQHDTKSKKDVNSATYVPGFRRPSRYIAPPFY